MKRFCAKQGCRTLVDRGYCAEHGPERRLPMDPRYGTQRWRETSAEFLARPENTRCKRCGRLSEVTDHIVSVRQAPERFFDETNFQALCRDCNTKKG